MLCWLLLRPLAFCKQGFCFEKQLAHVYPRSDLNIVFVLEMSSVSHKVDFMAAVCSDLLEFNRIWSSCVLKCCRMYAVHTEGEDRQSAILESFVNE